MDDSKDVELVTWKSAYQLIVRRIMPKNTPKVELEYVRSFFADYCLGQWEPSFCKHAGQVAELIVHSGKLPHHLSLKLYSSI